MPSALPASRRGSTGSSKKTVPALWQYDQMLCKPFMSGVEGVDGLQYFGPQGIRNRMGVFS